MTIGLTDDIGPLGSFPILLDSYLKGGMRVVVDNTERDAIDSSFRRAGMLVWSQVPDTLYQLGPGLGNGDWVVASFGGGGGATADFIYDSGAVESGNVYSNAANLMIAIAATVGLVRVQLITNLNVTSGNHDLSTTSFYSGNGIQHTFTLSGTTTLSGLPASLHGVALDLATGSQVYSVSGTENISLFDNANIDYSVTGSTILVGVGTTLNLFCYSTSSITGTGGGSDGWLDASGTVNAILRDDSIFDFGSSFTTNVSLSGVGDSWLTNQRFFDAAGLWTPDLAGRYVKIVGSTTPANDGNWYVSSASPTQLILDKSVGGAEAFTGTWSFYDGTINTYVYDNSSTTVSFITFIGTKQFFYDNNKKTFFITGNTFLTPGSQTVIVDTPNAVGPIIVYLDNPGPGASITIKDNGNAHIYNIYVYVALGSSYAPFTTITNANSAITLEYSQSSFPFWKIVSEYYPKTMVFTTDFTIAGGYVGDDAFGANMGLYAADGGYGIALGGGQGGYVNINGGWGGDADAGFSPGYGGGVFLTSGNAGFSPDTGIAEAGQVILTGGYGSFSGGVLGGGKGGTIRVNAGSGGDGGSAGASGDGGDFIIRLGVPGVDGGAGVGLDGVMELRANSGNISSPVFRFYDADASNYTGIRAKPVTTADVDYQLPPADGTSGQVLSTNGSGILSWITAGGGGGGLGDVTINATLSTGVSYPSYTTIHTHTTGTFGTIEVISYDVMVSCGDASSNHSIFKIAAVFRQDTGTVTLRDMTFVNGPYKEDASMDVQFNISGSDIQLQVISPNAVSAWRATGYISVVVL